MLFHSHLKDISNYSYIVRTDVKYLKYSLFQYSVMEIVRMVHRELEPNINMIDDMKHIKASDEIISFRVRNWVKKEYVRVIKAYGYYNCSESLRNHMVSVVNQAKKDGVIE